MKYEEIETQFMGITQKDIIIDNEDGSFKSFPADESNPEYVAFLASISESSETTTEEETN